MSDYPPLLRLIETMATLRGEGGCAWDREQDHQSLVPYLIEEVHELVDAIESGDVDEMREELGDVLYQLLFHADIAREDPAENFSIDDVARGTDEKMRRRHPHVFGDVEVDNVEQIRDNWAAIKAEEQINSVRDRMREEHYARLELGTYSVHAGIIFLDYLNRLEKIGDHIMNVNEAAAGKKFRQTRIEDPVTQAAVGQATARLNQTAKAEQQAGNKSDSAGS